jgi:spermidine synthase/S-adenosylmethionine decarboxylase
MHGLHILAELHDCRCEPALLLRADELRRLCLEACAAAGLTVVAEVFHGFGTAERPAGATGAVVLAESHLAVHTWPELKAVTLDLYVCNFSRDNRAAAHTAFDRLSAVFAPARTARRDMERGGLNDGAALRYP